VGAPEEGCGVYVLTEETQNGWLARMSSLLMPNRMSTWHQRWLKEAQELARWGMPKK
jgi:hypothetical protein